MSEHEFTNELIHETSPYLLQHAHNPVDWHAWNSDAFKKAKSENKLILVSIGYSTCHWCHVMERESFEDQSVASLMNELFVNIKVDREERPDVDMIYMEAVQLLTGSGGWPLNCFLLPDGRPFYGGTYFPPDERFGRASWRQVLLNISKAYQTQPNLVIQQAEKLTNSIQGNEERFISKIDPAAQTDRSKNDHSKIFLKLKDQFDKQDGGFGGAPKFPQTKSLDLLLSIYHYTGNQEALAHAEFSLKKMMRGGIYDHLRGGFARYATDSAWLIPHFEKMLYDNALLIRSLSDLFRITKDPEVKRIIHETLEFIHAEMTHPDGGFFSALDADSEGVEGKFYVWKKGEIDKVLGEDSTLFCEIYDVTEEGNWEETNILNLKESVNFYCKLQNLNENEILNFLQSCKDRLLSKRHERIRPQLDDKILVGWNAIMVTALTEAGLATGESNYISQAEFHIGKLKLYFSKEDGGLFHTYKNETATIEGMLDDYACLIEANILLFGATQNEDYLFEAKRLADFSIKNFYDETDGLFFFTSVLQDDIILRKKELFDNATPSGNAVMCRNLLNLGIVFDIESYSQIALQMLKAIDRSANLYPASFGYWAKNLLLAQYGIEEIVISGLQKQQLISQIHQTYSPGRILMQVGLKKENWPLLINKENSEETLIYLCKDFNCFKPVSNLEELAELLKNYS